MKCPYCRCNDDRVIDSRIVEDSSAIRRRRECASCGRRFSTYERVETTPIIVIKKDNSGQEYSREKIMSGIMRACVKRPVRYEDMEKIASGVETNIMHSGLCEIESSKIGDMVLEGLAKLDKVAYIRFASVYKRFDDVESFINELEKLKNIT
ncbi:MAG: transcriptional repressor NrdR [Oscillospiraceae bacterium]|nr:transcriptional repressor NrdR [Oscillospiraceae bacterium]